MEDRRTAFAVILSIIIILAYQKFLGDQKRYELEQHRAKNGIQNIQQPQATAQYATNQTGAAVNAPTAGQPQIIQPAATALNPSEEELHGSASTTINTALTKISLIHLGARISGFELKNFKVRVGADEALNLVSHQAGEPLPLGVYYGAISDSKVLYQLERAQGALQSPLNANIFDVQNNESEFVFKGTLSNGSQIRKTLIIQPNSYLITVKVELEPKTDAALPIWLEWATFVPEAVANERYNLYQFKTLTAQNKINSIFPPDVSKQLSDYGNNQWASFGDIYFFSALVPKGSGMNTKIGRERDTYLMRLASENQTSEFSLFVGPKYHSELQKIGFQLERNVDLGWFSFLAHPLLWLLRFFHSLLGNWGLAIIALTLLVKLALLPLTQVSFKSMKAMQDLQPEIKALRERIKDPTQLNQEMLGLYKKRGVNPVGGCFPMVLQIPVFLGLYNALLNAMELRHAPFALWINDLASPERLELFGIGVPVMILIMGASMFVQQWTTPTTADPAQKKAMMLMPFMFTGMFIIFPFPSGLVLYWLVNNLISIVQQVYLRGSSKASPLQATIIASVGIFALGYILTLL
jgi:YidC/Oxa1 family membrane protein insertase